MASTGSRRLAMRGRRPLALLERDLGPRPEPLGALDDELLAGLHTAVERRIGAFGDAELHRPHLDRLVVLHDPDERTLRAALDGGLGHERRRATDLELEARVHELVREECLVVV